MSFFFPRSFKKSCWRLLIPICHNKNLHLGGHGNVDLYKSRKKEKQKGF